MTKMKRVFSLLLAAVLVLSVFGVTASASVATGKSIAIIGEASGSPVAGGTIDYKFYIELPAGVSADDYYIDIFNLYLSYNTKQVVPVSRAWNTADYDHFSETILATGNAIGRIKDKLTTDEISKYDGACVFGMGQYSTTGSYHTTTGWKLVSQKSLIATITFKVLDSWDGSDINIGVLDNAFDATRLCYIRAFTDVKNTDVASNGKYLLAAIDNQTMATFKAASYKVTDEKVQIRRNSEDATKYDLRFVGSFKTADIETKFAENSNTSTNITSVGCKVTMNGVTNTYTDGYIYPTADGYKFAAIMPGLTDEMADMDITVEMFVVVDGVTESSAGVTTKLSAHTGRLPA